MDKEEIRAFFNQRAAHWDDMFIHDAEKIALILDCAGSGAGMGRASPQSESRLNVAG